MLSSDMFSGVIYQTVVISPAISWILQPGRFSKRQGFFYAVAFLVAMAALAIGVEFSEQASNFYHIVGVPRDASLSDIKKAFRVRSVELHPDKNPSANAAAEFTRLRLAFDVLGDSEKRGLYDLYGEGAIDKARDALKIETMIQALSFYGVWAVFSYVLTLSETARDARAWSYVGIVVLFIAELNLQFAGASLPPSFFPFMTIHEFTRMLRAAFPLYMNGTRAIGGYFYRDVAQENLMLGVELLKSNRAILLSMRELQGEVASSRRRVEPAKNVKADSLPAAARKRLKFDKASQSAINSSIAQGAKAEAEAAAPDVDTWNPEAEVPQPAVQTPPQFQIPGFVYFIVVYFALNYLFS
ncbi:hypothetical protein Poli38472_013902 [Pythium oligandrum]|uniref:J domain-containing protein n=1 Tax=Pythium oligandrum TaxID=41045 RepID=A0A8K1F9E8_PYTOL|nr:hypothetical protein Poli38472_013902 [Pythium oligandrum]|eukprot:TMW55140.1 hypothetical protein Poli38472_013902 [Pythium oligandrum]